MSTEKPKLESQDAPKKRVKKVKGLVVPQKKKKKKLFTFTVDGKRYSLTSKQKLFSDYFMRDLNGVQSALKVYNTKDYKTASVIASENLEKPNIVAYLTIQFAKFEITPDETMAHLSYITRQFTDLQAKCRGVDMSLKVFGKYAAERIEHSVDKKMKEFLDRVSKDLP